MHVKGFLHKMLSSVMHKKRLVTLSALVTSLLTWKKLSVTELGRGLALEIHERSGIRRADRFIGNNKLKGELKSIFQQQIYALVGHKKRPRIIVDWTHVPNTTLYVLRAALFGKGRAITLYEEVHIEKNFGTPRIEKRFLVVLKELLPKECRPIVITDAGFRNSWFKQIMSFNWDFVGRIRGTHTYFNGKKWIECRALLNRITIGRKYLGKVQLCKGIKGIITHLYLFKEKLKKRQSFYNKKFGGKDERSYRRAAEEPWILASSLSGENWLKLNRIIKIYKMRMQIEEGFRDLKSSRYGFSFRNAWTRSKDRIAILLLIAMLAALIAWLTGWIAEKKNRQYQFQVNSTKNRRILSLFYLGCQIIRKEGKMANEQLESLIIEVWRFSI